MDPFDLEVREGEEGGGGAINLFDKYPNRHMSRKCLSKMLELSLTLEGLVQTIMV